MTKEANKFRGTTDWMIRSKILLWHFSEIITLWDISATGRIAQDDVIAFRRPQNKQIAGIKTRI